MQFQVIDIQPTWRQRVKDAFITSGKYTLAALAGAAIAAGAYYWLHGAPTGPEAAAPAPTTYAHPAIKAVYDSPATIPAVNTAAQ